MADEFNMKIVFAGDEQLNKNLGLQIKRIKDLRPAWKDMSSTLNLFQQRVFKSRGAGDGLPKWQKLAASTIAAKGHDRPLILTGKLRGAMTRNKAAGALRLFTKKEFRWGVDDAEVPYAKWHQTGTKRLPVRKPLRLTTKMRKDLVKIMQRHIIYKEEFKRVTR